MQNFFRASPIQECGFIPPMGILLLLCEQAGTEERAGGRRRHEKHLSRKVFPLFMFLYVKARSVLIALFFVAFCQEAFFGLY